MSGMTFEKIPTATLEELEHFIATAKPDTEEEARIYDFAYKRLYDLRREKQKNAQ